MKSFERSFGRRVWQIFITAGLTLVAGATPGARAQTSPVIVEVDGAAAKHDFPHYWEKMFGSGRASLSLRESYRQDLRQVKQATDVGYIRFHAIFLDDMGVYDED